MPAKTNQLRESLENNPFPYNYIVIEGNIASGKTSFCEKIADIYGCRLILEQFEDNPFLPYFYEDQNRYAFAVELFFMTERIKQLQRSLINQDLFSAFTVADYAFVKSLLFARKNLSEEEFRMFAKMFNAFSSSFPNPDILVYFHRGVVELMSNITKRGRAYEQYIQQDYLQTIQDSYFEYFRNILSFPLLIVDVTGVDFVSNDVHYATVESLLKKQYLPGVHRISLSI